MQFLQDLIQINRQGSYPQNHYQNSQRINYTDMLKAFPSYTCGRNDLERGVLEFVAPENCCYLPFWMFQMLQLFEGQEILITMVSGIQKGSFVKIQPHETAFIDLPDPRAILEKELRNYISLTQGDTINIEFMKKEYKIDILEIKPINEYNCISVVDADIQLDFAQPLSSNIVMNQEVQKNTSNNVFSGKSQRIDGRTIDSTKLQQKGETKEEYDPRKHRISHGVRRKIINQSFKGQYTKIGKSQPIEMEPKTKKLICN